MEWKEAGVRILGSAGGKSEESGMSAFQLSPRLLVDAGHLLEPLGEKIYDIDHIFLTHSHLDHICDIPFLVEKVFDRRSKSIKIYGFTQTLDNLHKHLFNDDVWVDFTRIPIDESGQIPAVTLIPIEAETKIEVEGWKLTAIPTDHIPGSCGYMVEKEGKKIFISSDTAYDPSLMKWLEDSHCTAAIFECSMPDRLSTLAKNSKHLTPATLQMQLDMLKNRDITIYCNHIKPAFEKDVLQELAKMPIGCHPLKDGDFIRLKDGRLIHFFG